jgi:HEPN domain-containing protein
MEAINISITQTQYRDKNIEGSYYSKDEAKEYIRTLKNK